MSSSPVLLCLMLAVIVPAAWTQTPKKCCMPEQFTVFRSALVAANIEGTGGATYYDNQDTAYDFKNNRIGINSTQYHFTSPPFQLNYRSIQDFNKKTVWTIIPSQKTCVKESITSPILRCVPENATFGGHLYMADKALYIDSWNFILDNYVGLSGFFTVSFPSDGSCVPLADQFVGKSTTGGTKMDMTLTGGYVNYTQGIKDPDRYFTLPDYCEK